MTENRETNAEILRDALVQVSKKLHTYSRSEAPGTPIADRAGWRAQVLGEITDIVDEALAHDKMRRQNVLAAQLYVSIAAALRTRKTQIAAEHLRAGRIAQAKLEIAEILAGVPEILDDRLSVITSQELISSMAEAAHDAWLAAYRAEGFESRKAEWGEEFMVPFGDLSERGQEFDRTIMRAILNVMIDRGLVHLAE